MAGAAVGIYIMWRPLIVALCSATGALRVGPRSLAHGAVRRAAAAVSVATDTGFGSAPMPDDLNLLETLLYDAVQREDYAAAAELRDRIGWLSGARGGDTDWRELGLPEWLSDWLGRLGYGWGTRVQVQALRGLTEISGGQTRHRDAAIVAPTGSGKTLAYLLPLLRRFSEDLLQEAPAAPGHERVASPLSPPSAAGGPVAPPRHGDRRRAHRPHGDARRDAAPRGDDRCPVARARRAGPAS